ncbi:hypothetical protein EFQ99_26285 [Rhizobium vallis]|uniref:Uncharacterized protein n=1 Tax=Rhizobium vallis TaxID=634290 RepID=A0A432PDW9_9HYPH|nr:hypothetical protein EFQ99_26285 [Rhizobium vallis]
MAHDSRLNRGIEEGRLRIQKRHVRLLAKPANSSFVMLGLVPSICLRPIGQQILGTGPRMTSHRGRGSRGAPKGHTITLNSRECLSWPY